MRRGAVPSNLLAPACPPRGRLPTAGFDLACRAETPRGAPIWARIARTGLLSARPGRSGSRDATNPRRTRRRKEFAQLLAAGQAAAEQSGHRARTSRSPRCAVHRAVAPRRWPAEPWLRPRGQKRLGPRTTASSRGIQACLTLLLRHGWYFGSRINPCSTRGLPLSVCWSGTRQSTSRRTQPGSAWIRFAQRASRLRPQ